MVNFYVTNQYFDKKNKLITAGQTVIITEDLAKTLIEKNCGYILSKVNVKQKNK